MTKEDAVRETLYGYLHAGLIECSAQRVLSYIADDLIGFGIGEQGFVSSRTDVLAIMSDTVKEHRDAVYALDFRQVEVRFPSEEVACVCATVLVRRTAEGSTTQSGLYQSLTMRLEHGAWKIAALHASPMILSEEGIDVYPLEYAEKTLAQLRSELQKETFDLMNKSFSGGILSCRRCEGRLPLYFINDSMLSYLD